MSPIATDESSESSFSNTQSLPRPRVAVVMGDPAGIGPELAAKLLADPKNYQKADIFVLADISEVHLAESLANVSIPIISTAGPTGVQVLDDNTTPTTPIQIGQVSKAAGERVMHQLTRAVELANTGKVDAIFFTPLNKTSCHLAGMHEEDELRWFAKALKYEGVTSEINITTGLWTSRVTSHIGIKDVAARVKKQRVFEAIELLHNSLWEYGISQPRLGVCALNPHNGENGLFGREEIDEIIPGVAIAQERGIIVEGPFPSDTIFLQNSRKAYDGIVTMYHDQGQIAIKLLGFDGGVTVQGGLPVVIATPAHGTAFNIVGKNLASVTSSQNALDVAIAMAARRAAKKLGSHHLGVFGTKSLGKVHSPVTSFEPQDQHFDLEKVSLAFIGCILRSFACIFAIYASFKELWQLPE